MQFIKHFSTCVTEWLSHTFTDIALILMYQITNTRPKNFLTCVLKHFSMHYKVGIIFIHCNNTSQCSNQVAFLETSLLPLFLNTFLHALQIGFHRNSLVEHYLQGSKQRSLKHRITSILKQVSSWLTVWLSHPITHMTLIQM